MKTVFAFVLFLVLILSHFNAVDAHLPGQDPFFKINGKYSDLYLVYSTSLEDLELPQDIAKDTYLVNKEINFELDKEKLPVAPAFLDDVTFEWNFGDGEKGTGLANTHTYKKPGSYILTINAKGLPELEDQVFQSVMLHVLPNNSYKLPRATITIDGKKVNDSILDIVEVSEGKEALLDSSQSQVSDGTKYLWDLGDGKSSNAKSVKKSFQTTPEQEYFFPVLRIIDENGFISDTYVQIHVKKGAGSANISLRESFAAVSFLVGAVAIVTLGFFYKNKQPKRS